MDGGMQFALEPGQQWAHPKGGPWPGHETPVTIVDVRDGWVRYDHPAAADQRSEAAWFCRYYSVRVA